MLYSFSAKDIDNDDLTMNNDEHFMNKKFTPCVIFYRIRIIAHQIDAVLRIYVVKKLCLLHILQCKYFMYQQSTPVKINSISILRTSIYFIVE